MKSMKSRKRNKIISTIIIVIMVITLSVICRPALATDYAKVNEIIVGVQQTDDSVETTNVNGSSDLKAAGESEETESVQSSSEKTTTTLPDGTVVVTETITEEKEDGTTVTEIIKELTKVGDISYDITYTDPSGNSTVIEIDPEEIAEFLDKGFQISGEDLTEALKGQLNIWTKEGEILPEKKIKKRTPWSSSTPKELSFEKVFPDK